MGAAVTQERAAVALLRALGVVRSVEFTKLGGRLVAYATEPSKGKIDIVRVASIEFTNGTHTGTTRKVSKSTRSKQSEAMRASWVRRRQEQTESVSAT